MKLGKGHWGVRENEKPALACERARASLISGRLVPGHLPLISANGNNDDNQNSDNALNQKSIVAIYSILHSYYRNIMDEPPMVMALLWLIKMSVLAIVHLLLAIDQK